MSKSHSYLIVGLGNPGENFAATRHNIGREILHAAQKTLRFPEFRPQAKWNAEISQKKLGPAPLTLLCPNTFVNKSGGAVAPAARMIKAKPDHILVVHDDADIALGRAKLSFGKRSAGHKGVESVMRAIKTKDFWRFRIGIAGRRNIPAEKLVLKKFTAQEKTALRNVVKKTIAALGALGKEPMEKIMSTYNRI